jgi:hypothetical protein
MTTDTANVLDGEGWRDGLEAGVRRRIRGFIEELLEEELTAALGRARYGRAREPERLPLAAVRVGQAAFHSHPAVQEFFAELVISVCDGGAVASN